MQKTRVGAGIVQVRTLSHPDPANKNKQTAASSLEYLHRDHLGSVEAVTDASGARLATLAYDPFGARRKADWTRSLNSGEIATLADDLWGGGSTRLRILKELAAETGESRFAVAQCLLRPWRGEAELPLSHIKENELRGVVPFVDLAVAVANLRAMLEREAGAPFDERRLVRRLGALGFEIDCGTIALATYVVERLSSALPLAAQGLSRSDIESTRSLDQGTRALWRDWSIDAVEEYDRVFRTLCARYDGPGWALSDVRRALVEEMAVRGGRSSQAVALELQARLSRLGTSGDNR